MKMAVAHFQCAAWAFHTLPDLYAQVDMVILRMSMADKLNGIYS